MTLITTPDIEKRIKRSLISKDITDYAIDKEKVLTQIPKAGDVAVFEIIKIGKHTNLQSDQLNNVHIYEGDYILGAFGNRYATSQFEGYVPTDIRDTFHIIGAGGVIGIIKSMNVKFEDIGPTIIKIVGYATDRAGKVINTIRKDELLHFSPQKQNDAKVILSVGSSMDSGKTTTAGWLARGLKHAGKKVAFMKLTGTVYTKDKDYVYDLGADLSVDFSDLGYPSTFMLEKEEILNIYQTLLAKVAFSNPDFIVMEIADGLFERETNFLLKDTNFLSTIDKVMFSCGDSLSAIQGINTLKELGIVPVLISGLFTMSPLLIEEVQTHCTIPTATLFQLSSKSFLEKIIFTEVTSASSLEKIS